jgi:UDP-N-acetyl-D-glucosamine dehydrogenase
MSDSVAIAIVGLGYVGLTLSLQFARSCVSVLGLDADPKKVELLNKGQSYIKHIQSADIAELVAAGKFSASTDFGQIKHVEAVINCVPTPLNKNREPDLSYVLQTGRSIAPHLQPGTLVVLESTTYPGTTEEDLRVILEENTCFKPESSTVNSSRYRMRAGINFIWLTRQNPRDPGNQQIKVKRIPQSCGSLLSDRGAQLEYYDPYVPVIKSTREHP